MFVCVVDLGSLYCRAMCLGWNTDEQRYHLLGLVELASSGVVQGEVVNIEKAYATLLEALSLLEHQVRVSIREISLVYSGVTLGCHNSWGITGTTPIRNSSDPRDSSARCVTEGDINRALNSAAELRISADFERLHEIPRCYKLDGKVVKRDILGCNGIRLEVEVHIITCRREAVEYLIEVASRGQQYPVEIVHSSIAASYISLTSEELNQGCLLIDMGFGSTSFQYSFEGQPLVTESLGLGGYHITRDIAEIFGIPFEVAEQLKLQHGICWPAFVTAEEQVVIPGGATSMAKRVSRLTLCDVLNARIEEIFEIICGRLRQYGVQSDYIQSVVLVGGSSLLPGMSELAEEVFEGPARLGLPDEPLLVVDTAAVEVDNCLTPQYTALFGLALYWLEEERRHQVPGSTPLGRTPDGGGESPPPVSSWWTLLLNWVKRKLA